MAMRFIRPETMIMISRQWLNELLPLLEGIPITMPFVPVIQRAHDDLLAKQSLGSLLDAELSVLQDRITLLDLLHDRKQRGTYYVLTGLAEAANDPAAAAAILTLRDHLFPDGLASVNRSYLDQAGDAHRLPARLNPAQTQLLSTLRTPDGTLDQYVEQWRAAAIELAALETQRAGLLTQRASGEGGATPDQARQAVLHWVRVAQALQSNLMVDETVPEDVRARILAPLQRAELQARRRRNRGGAPDAEQPIDSEQPTPTEPPTEGDLDGDQPRE